MDPFGLPPEEEPLPPAFTNDLAQVLRNSQVPWVLTLEVIDMNVDKLFLFIELEYGYDSIYVSYIELLTDAV